MKKSAACLLLACASLAGCIVAPVGRPYYRREVVAPVVMVPAPVIVAPAVRVWVR